MRQRRLEKLLLNEALATELVCVLRYKRHYFMARGINAESVAREFAEHAGEEMEHADQLASRIVQLGGEPNFSPECMSRRSYAEYREGRSLAEMVMEDLVAERIAIDSYREILTYLGDNDPTTSRLVEDILATEEEHAEDLVSLLHNGESSDGVGDGSHAEPVKQERHGARVPRKGFSRAGH